MVFQVGPSFYIIIDHPQRLFVGPSPIAYESAAMVPRASGTARLAERGRRVLEKNALSFDPGVVLKTGVTLVRTHPRRPCARISSPACDSLPRCRRDRVAPEDLLLSALLRP